MTPHFGQIATKLLDGRPGEENSSKELAGRASDAFEGFAQHLSRLLGRIGVEMLLDRSVALASVEIPWLPKPGSGSRALLREVMERQEPAAITAAFVAILSALVGLLDRLVGAALVERLLHEVWPAVFMPAGKDTP